jgi:hypothetical protein
VAVDSRLKVQGKPDFILAGDGNKLCCTKNGGTSWTDIMGTLPVATNYLTDAVMNDSDPEMIWANSLSLEIINQ